MNYFRDNPSREEARAYYNDWIETVYSWDLELGRELTEGAGPSAILSSTDELPMSEKLFKIALYAEKGPPGSSIRDLAKAAYCQLIIGNMPFEVAKTSIQMGHFGLIHYAKRLVIPDMELDLDLD